MERSKLSPVSILTVVMVFLSMAGLDHAVAQNLSSRYGTWKLNLAKSNMTLPPKSLTRTDEPAGDGVKVTYEGIEADGTRIAYSYTAKYDGKEYRPTGVGMANGWKPSHSNVSMTIHGQQPLKRAGKVVSMVTVVVSKDGKTMTQTVNGTNAAGEPTHSVSIWEKQ